MLAIPATVEAPVRDSRPLAYPTLVDFTDQPGKRPDLLVLCKGAQVMIREGKDGVLRITVIGDDINGFQLETTDGNDLNGMTWVTVHAPTEQRV